MKKVASSASAGVTLLDTAVGRWAIVWSSRGIAGAALPELNGAGTLAR